MDTLLLIVFTAVIIAVPFFVLIKLFDLLDWVRYDSPLGKHLPTMNWDWVLEKALFLCALVVTPYLLIGMVLYGFHIVGIIMLITGGWLLWSTYTGRFLTKSPANRHQGESEGDEGDRR